MKDDKQRIKDLETKVEQMHKAVLILERRLMQATAKVKTLSHTTSQNKHAISSITQKMR